tara:strand:+ start:1778 stop:2605 length:828 start_codon:yes stop_codon:yes gene_type:complete
MEFLENHDLAQWIPDSTLLAPNNHNNINSNTVGAHMNQPPMYNPNIIELSNQQSTDNNQQSTDNNQQSQEQPPATAVQQIPHIQEQDVQEELTTQSAEPKVPNSNFRLESESVALSLALLISTITIGATLDTMECNWIHYIQKSIFPKLFLIFITIYFTISYSHHHLGNSDPMKMIKTSLIVLIFYILFSRMNIVFTNAVVASFFMLLLYKDYTKFSTIPDDDVELQSNLYNIIKLIGIIIIIGFWWHYHNERKRMGSKNFDNFEFLFSTKCKKI